MNGIFNQYVQQTHTQYLLQYLSKGKLCPFEYHIDFYSSAFYKELPSKYGINNSRTSVCTTVCTALICFSINSVFEFLRKVK